MPIKIPNDLPASKILKEYRKENIKRRKYLCYG